MPDEDDKGFTNVMSFLGNKIKDILAGDVVNNPRMYREGYEEDGRVSAQFGQASQYSEEKYADKQYAEKQYADKQYAEKQYVEKQSS